MRLGHRARAGVLVCAAVIATLVAAAGGLDRAGGEQTQKGTLISALRGELRPSILPRDRPAPIALHLEGRLRTEGGSVLPRVTGLEIGLPAEGLLSTRGLPICPRRRLDDTRTGEALAACREALVGRGRLDALVLLPNQAPFPIHARLLAFNSRIGKRRAVLLHAGSGSPPTSAVLPMTIESRPGRFGRVLVGHVSAALGPWPRLRRFEITLSRRYRYRGSPHSYLSARCPIPPALPAGSFSLARVSYSLAGGEHLSTGIARNCRAR
jgi:hypothetical protein